MTYSEQLKHPSWQKKRLEILQRDEFTCQHCSDKEHQLHVHHRYYVSGRYAWEYPDFCYLSLCADCHKEVKIRTEEMRNQGHCVFEDWEHGLAHFGDRIFDMAAEEIITKP